MKDALGQEIAAGDHVAYVRKSGSRLRIERRVIERLADDGTLRLAPTKRYGGIYEVRGGGAVQPYNVVKVAP